MALLEVDDLKVHFPVRGGFFQRPVDVVKAVDGVSLRIERGQTLGLVGESGSGKSTLGRAIMRLTKPTSGDVRYDGVDLLPMPESEFRPLRKRMQMVFQDPFGSLNPRFTVGRTLREPLELHFPNLGKSEREDRVASLLERVGLPADARRRYPHEFSGGQRQRIGIARALSVEPEFIVCDEPVSSLDVSVQAQIVNLLQDLQDELGLTYLFIAHDLAVVQHISDQVAVMYRGVIVESGTADQICEDPQDDYTQKLLGAVPQLG